MQRVIEQVVTSDESARGLVAEARKKAKALVEEAGREAEALARSGRDRLAQVEKTEIEPIIAGAKQEAEETLAGAEHFIRRLQATVAAGKDHILDAFLALVLEKGEPYPGTSHKRQHGAPEQRPEDTTTRQ